MKRTINHEIKHRRNKLFFVFIITLSSYHLISIPFLFLYPQDNPNNVPRLLSSLYTKIQASRDVINVYINENPVLLFLTDSEIVKFPILLLFECFILFIPIVFYRNEIIKFYIPKIKSLGILDNRGTLLFSGAIFSLIAYTIINPYYFSISTFPSFDLESIFYWLRYIIIACFLAPFGEELLFRGVVLNEIKYCYNLSSRATIFFQAFIFLLFHILLRSDFPLPVIWVGIATGIFAFYTNSLLYSFLYHMCNNIFLLLMQNGFINLAKYEIPYFNIIPFTLLFFGLNILFIMLFSKYMKKKFFSSKNSKTLCNTTSRPE